MVPFANNRVVFLRNRIYMFVALAMEIWSHPRGVFIDDSSIEPTSG